MVYQSEKRSARIALTGDAVISRPMSVFAEPKFLELVELLRSTDATVTNAETLFHDFEHWPTVAPGGTYMRAEPGLIGQLRWLGVNMLATANNHAYDYGEHGLLTHLGHLRSSGVAFAGVGRTMGEAREPAYLDTPNGRVALISVTTSGPPGLYAGHQWRDGKGRPGANMIRYTTEYTVDGPIFDAVRRMRDQLGLAKRARRGPTGLHRDHSFGLADQPDTDTSFYMPVLVDPWQYPVPDGCRVVLGDVMSSRQVAWDVDVDEVLQRVRDARRMADWVVVSIHNHEKGGSEDEPSELARMFARLAIDAGADVIHGHGPHRDRGIELYRGRPIVYSIGHFILQNDTISRMAMENYRRQKLDVWESTPADYADQRSGREWMDEWRGMAASPAAWRDVVVVVNFSGGELTGLDLHPIDLGFRRPRSQRGRPVLAGGETAQAALEHMRELCEPFGTRVEIVDGIGRIAAK